MTSTPSSEGLLNQKPSVTAGSASPSSGETCNGNAPKCGASTQTPKSFGTSGEDSTGSARDSSPYWSEFTGGISSLLWLPTGTGSPGSDLNSSSGWSSKTAGRSWFSTSRMPAPNPSLPKIYSPSSIRSAAGCTDSAATGPQSRRIQVYPNQVQKRAIASWLDASRWTYNLSVELLRAGAPAAWRTVAKTVMSELDSQKPEWRSVPYQIKRTSVRDACRAMQNVKAFNAQLAQDKAAGCRLDEDFAELGFRSRKNPRQSCYIPDDAITQAGVYRQVLGPLLMAEPVPPDNKESRLVKERDKYWLTIPYPAQCDIETPRGDGVVALDPGVRSFLTFFSEADCGKVGYHAFGRIQRLCQHLDRLISRTDQEKNRKKRRNMRKAQARMRQKLINLVDELHWQCARWLTSNYRVILLPKFETQSMTRRGERQIQSKTARMMLSFQHYRFKKRLQWKAWQRGSLVLEVNEAYTSRTRSWDGRVDEKLGGSRTIRDESGFIMDRDINGARGIFLRALGDSPFLRELLTRVASQQTSTLLNIC